MIIDAYIPTITHTSVDIRIISHSGQKLIIIFNGEREKAVRSFIHNYDLYFFFCRFSGLTPARHYSVKIFQEPEDTVELKIKTLEVPAGRRICRFGILPDLHIASHSINRPDSGKRLYGKALELAEKYIPHLENQGAEFILFPGDTLDPASKENINLFRGLKNTSGIPFYPVIGNHEGWGNGNEKEFNSVFCQNEKGFYGFSRGNARFLMLNTPDQSSLFPHTEQYAWLKNELDKSGHMKNIFLSLHFSFILHPCVRGFKNDGMQQLYNSGELLALLKKYKGIKVVFAGHKNVPSKVMVDGIAHLLSPQLIQAPCSYTLIDLYETGLMCTVYEIDEQEYVWQSRQAFGNGWQERYGEEESRNFTLVF
jgi:hypothetical protein